MLNVDPVNPVWVPGVPETQDIAVFVGGGWGYFVRWGPVVSVRDPTHKKNVLVGRIFRLTGTAVALRNFLTLTTLGGVT